MANSENNTVISAEMFRKLRELGLDKGYKEVPDFLTPVAEVALAGRDIADIPEPMKNRLETASQAELEEREKALKEAEGRLSGSVKRD